MSPVSLPVLMLALPPDWSATDEVTEGQVVRVFRPPAPLPGVLRVLTDRITADPPGDAGAVAIKMREVALRFVRPDDPRATDRVIEDGRHGGIVAMAVMATEDDRGNAETHYLWLVAEPIAGEPAFRAAMAALAVPRDDDGTPAAVAVVAAADAMLGAAAFAIAGNP